MRKFDLNDKVSLIRDNIIKSGYEYDRIFNNSKINGIVVKILSDNNYIVYNKRYGYIAINENLIDFRFKKEREEFKKLGLISFKNKYNNIKVLDYFNNLVNKNDCTFILQNIDSFHFVDNNVFKNDKYIIKQIDRSINYSFIEINFIAKLTFTNFSERKEEDVLDYFSKTYFNIKFDKYFVILELNNTPNPIVHYCKNNVTNIALMNELPRLYINLEDNNNFINKCISFHTKNKIVINHDKFGNHYISCISLKNAVDNGFKESLYNGMFFSNIESKYNRYYGYEEFNNNSKNIGNKSSSYLSTEGINYTFGIEIEMQKCFIPNRLRSELNINCVRDGSINNRQGDRNGGPEFVTGVLSGDAGFLHLNKICNEITKRGELDQSCGLHVHIGGASFSEEFLVMSYILGCKLEKQFFDFVPKSRRNSEYCTKLKQLDFNFDNVQNNKDFRTRCSTYYKELFKYLCGSYPDSKVNKNTNHPRGRTCGYDHSSPRYNWLNFVPAVFNTKNSNNSWTLEFRIHSGTSNFVKIKNWIKLCMAFVYFADNYHDDILNNCVTINNVKEPLTIYNILKKVYPKSCNILIKYLEARLDKFSENNNLESLEYIENYKGVLELNNIKEILN
jgi:hypothetical protein